MCLPSDPSNVWHCVISNEAGWHIAFPREGIQEGLGELYQLGHCEVPDQAERHTWSEFSAQRVAVTQSGKQDVVFRLFPHVLCSLIIALRMFYAMEDKINNLFG